MKEFDPEKYPSKAVVDLLRLTGYLISKTFWFIRYSGRENIPAPGFGGFLIAANHQTYIDPVWICLPMGRKVRYMAVEKAFGWRLVGPLIAYLGAFPASDGVAGTRRTMIAAIRALQDGAALTIFPEGGREFADGQMLPFHTGAVRIALQARVPILPVTVSGGNRIWPRGQKYPSLFRRVQITYHPLVNPARKEGADLHETLNHWTSVLLEMIGPAQAKIKAVDREE